MRDEVGTNRRVRLVCARPATTCEQRAGKNYSGCRHHAFNWCIPHARSLGARQACSAHCAITLVEHVHSSARAHPSHLPRRCGRLRSGSTVCVVDARVYAKLASFDATAMARAGAAWVDRDALLARLLAIAGDEALRAPAADAGLARTIADARDLAPRRAIAACAITAVPKAIADQPTRHVRGARERALGARDQLADAGDARTPGRDARRVVAHCTPIGRDRARRICERVAVNIGRIGRIGAIEAKAAANEEPPDRDHLPHARHQVSRISMRQKRENERMSARPAPISVR